MFTQKKKANRKHQFDPISHSALYPVVAERVRLHVKEIRNQLYKDNEWRRDARRQLFDSISKIEQNFIPPQTSDENNARAISINKQIAIKTELKFALETLQCLMEYASSQFNHDPELEYKQLQEIQEEQREERNNLEVLRHLRKIMFLQKLSRECKIEMEARKKSQAEAEAQRKRDLAEELEEENILMIPSDRRLTACGLLQPIIKNPNN